MYQGPFRKGDVVRFRRGDNEYDGVVKGDFMHGLRVDVEMHGGVIEMTVRFGDVLRLEVPVLTEKERTALGALARRPRAATVRMLRDDGYKLSGATFAGLRERGLVLYGQATIESARVRHVWTLTEEGKRVARTLD